MGYDNYMLQQSVLRRFFLITTFNSFDYLSPDQVCYRDVKEKEIGKL